jgi:hypothetical protein
MADERWQCRTCGKEVEIRAVPGLGRREVLADRPKVIHACCAHIPSPRVTPPLESSLSLTGSTADTTAARRRSTPPENPRSTPKAVIERNCKYCNERIRLIWRFDECRYVAQARESGLTHACPAETFQPKRVQCTKCGATVVARLQKGSGVMALQEVDDHSRHECNRANPVTVVHARPVKTTKRVKTLAPAVDGRPPRVNAPGQVGRGMNKGQPKRNSRRTHSDETREDRLHCPACGNLLPAHGRDRSCIHCSF